MLWASLLVEKGCFYEDFWVHTRAPPLVQRCLGRTDGAGTAQALCMKARKALSQERNHLSYVCSHCFGVFSEQSPCCFPYNVASAGCGSWHWPHQRCLAPCSFLPMRKVTSADLASSPALLEPSEKALPASPLFSPLLCSPILILPPSLSFLMQGEDSTCATDLTGRGLGLPGMFSFPFGGSWGAESWGGPPETPFSLTIP